MTQLIKVWCEYNIGGSFGGNNDEAVFVVPDGTEQDAIDKFVTDYVVQKTGTPVEELEDLYDWEYITTHMIS